MEKSQPRSVLTTVPGILYILPKAGVAFKHGLFELFHAIFLFEKAVSTSALQKHPCHLAYHLSSS